MRTNRTMTAALGAAVLALWATAGEANTQQKRSGDSRNNERVTVDGCLSVNPAARTYILTVKPEGIAAAAPGDKTTTITYQLVGGSGLQQHVGHRIEVTGQVDPETTVTAESESKRGATGTSGQQGEPKPKVETKTETKIRAQVLRVKSFRFMEASCKPTEG